VAIAMQCNLKPPDAAPVLICFNYDAHACLKSPTYPLLSNSVLLLIRYVTLWPWPLTL